MKKLFFCYWLLPVLTILSSSAGIAQDIPGSEADTVFPAFAPLSDTLDIPARDRNCFRSFSASSSGRSNINTYLLSYLVTMSYPERLKRETGSSYFNTNNTAFRNDFINKFKPMFWNSTDITSQPVIDFKFLNPHIPNQAALMTAGIDPEVALISTPDYIIVCWRGTDRVWNPDNDYYEWIGTDFRAPLITQPGMFSGKVHGYIWHSVNVIKDQVDDFIEANGGATKQIWVTGHSLGAAQAELYTAYLNKFKNIPRSRLHCYMFSGPSFVGDATFVAAIHSDIGKSRLQRFEYAMDIVTLFPPGLATPASSLEAALFGEGCVLTCSYAKAGQRNWFKNGFNSGYIYNTSERSILSGDMVNPNSACDHNPNWIARAAYKQLSTTQQIRVPAPPPYTSLDACNPNGTPVTGIFPPPSDLADGKYYIRSAAGTKKYLNLDWNDRLDNGAAITIGILGSTTQNNVFRLKKVIGPLGGYTIQCNITTTGFFGNSVIKERFMDAESSQTNTNGCKIQAWDRSFPGFRTNQEWYIRPIANTGRYIIQCIKDGKVLDAYNNCVSNSSACSLQLWNAHADNLTQQWIFEKRP